MILPLPTVVTFFLVTASAATTACAFTPTSSWSQKGYSNVHHYLADDSTSPETSSSSKRTIVDRSTLTLLEHVNLNVPSHEHILPFYFDLLGCGLDPRKAANLKPGAPKKTLWANCGASQFHLPYGEIAQSIPGHIGLRYDSLEGLKKRLETAKGIKSYQVRVDERSNREYVKLVDMYENVFYCRAGEPVHTDKRQPIISPDETEEWGEHATIFGRQESECRALDYIEFNCPNGSAEKIALFYDSVLDATTMCAEDAEGAKIAIIAIGSVDNNGKADQSLLFRESSEEVPPYDGHHVAMYIGESALDFEQAFKNAKLSGIVWVNPRFSDEASDLEGARKWKQFRFKDIIDMETGEKIMELEHEMRSIEHEAWPGQR
jgi:hypothetical protein